jgi:quercetin dioxygenase-like cupin family protein
MPKLLEAGMRKAISVFSILVCVQTASVLAEQDVTVTDVMKGSRTIGGQSIEYPKTDKAEIGSVTIAIQPGKESGRHMHPFPTYVHVLEGTLTVEVEDGSRQSFKAGSGFLEAVNIWHNVKNLEEAPLRFLAVTAGVEGKSNVLRPERHRTSG